MQPNKSATGSAEAPCHGCGSPMRLVGTEQFRIGGTSGGWKLLFGEWAELGETMMGLEMWVCPSCRRVEFRVPGGYQPPEDVVRGLRYACPGCGGDVYQGEVKCASCGYKLKDASAP